LDRDGVINKDFGYVHTKEKFYFNQEIFYFCQQAIKRGYKIFVVTNQSGIGRGLYSEKDFLELTSWMVSEFANNGIEIKDVYYCPFHPTEGVGKYRKNSFDRKPNPGMILRAAIDHHIKLAESVLVGDQETDIQAGIAAGVGKLIRLLDQSEANGEENCLDVSARVCNVGSLIEALNFI